jgi:hypothetical protein
VVNTLAGAMWNRNWRSQDELVERCEYHQRRNAISYASRRKKAGLPLNTS